MGNGEEGESSTNGKVPGTKLFVGKITCRDVETGNVRSEDGINVNLAIGGTRLESVVGENST